MFTMRRTLTGVFAIIAALAPIARGAEPRDSGRSQAAAATTVTGAVKATVTLGGGKAVNGAQGVALDPSTGLVYIGLNGTIVGGCDGDGSRGSSLPQGPGAGQISIVDPAALKEIAAVPSGSAPVWPTVDPDRRTVYMSNSGNGTVTVHDAATGARLSTITVGGKPHMGGLDYSTRNMVVSNTVRTSSVTAEQIYASVINTSTSAITREFTTSAAPHGVVVDQERDLIYFSGVLTGEITVINAATGQTLFSADPNAAYGTSFGNNNMLVRQAATKRLFQSNSQPNYTGALVADEVTLNAEGVIRFNDPASFVWGMWVDEPNRLLFAALPNANAIGVADLDTLTHVATIPVGECPYAVAIDPVRRVGVSSNQGSPTVNATASIFDLCPVYSAANRIVSGCTFTPPPSEPGAPTSLIGLADGSDLTLAWKNASGSVATALNVTGAYTGSLPLTGSAETFQYQGVPSGSYTFTIAGRNSSGTTVSSSALTLTFPGTCTAPQAPANFAAAKSGRTITLSWDPPSSGAAPASYLVTVTGAYVGTVPVTGRTVAGTVSPGSYTLSVAAVNRCGTSGSTASQTVAIS